MTRSISFGVDPLGAVGQHFGRVRHLTALQQGSTERVIRSSLAEIGHSPPIRPRTAIPMINMHPMHRGGQLDRNAVPPGVTFVTSRSANLVTERLNERLRPARTIY